MTDFPVNSATEKTKQFFPRRYPLMYAQLLKQRTLQAQVAQHSG